jgi:hypothetical protein
VFEVHPKAEQWDNYLGTAKCSGPNWRIRMRHHEAVHIENLVRAGMSSEIG